MRRGHSGFGGWRNENSRHFRPRGRGQQSFRPNRNYSLQETQRFSHPGQRPHRDFSYSNHPLLHTQNLTSEHNRNHYRQEGPYSNQYFPERGHNQRSNYHQSNHVRQGKNDLVSAFDESKKYYDNLKNDQCHVNNMGDIDHRQIDYMYNIETFNQYSIPPWSSTPENSQYDNVNFHKGYRDHDSVDGNKIPNVEFSGHRPPASDHYGSDPNSSFENSNSFSRSVDDTVDIIRKRLQNRNEPALTSEEQQVAIRDIDERQGNINNSNNYQNEQNQNVKKRVQRQKPIVEVNCDKMKSKIVRELFKMDKDKIHKLMDNPSSSSKFEYALSSLITESQNSLNQHLRSVAEKSLCNSSEFVHHDNNTIYEDTFMKQMLGILDPQDTVLLEDIKPLVLSELSKVLQLNEHDQPFQIAEDPLHLQQNYEQLDSCTDNYSNEYYDDIQTSSTGMDNYVSRLVENDVPNYSEYFDPGPVKPKPLFERRLSFKNLETYPKGNNNNEDHNILKEAYINERRNSRKSQELSEGPGTPLFDTTSEQLLEDEDPFAELDKQYHVAVDHNFIDTCSISSPQQPAPCMPKSPITSEDDERSSVINTSTVKREIEDQHLQKVMSPLKVSFGKANNRKNIENKNAVSDISIISVKQELSALADSCIEIDSKKTNTSSITRSDNDHSQSKTDLPQRTRKRSNDQKPSHRKEKRKKSDNTPLDSSKHIMNKNIIINFNDCASKDSNQCQDTAKSIFNQFFSKTDSNKEVLKDTKKVETSDKTYSDKYVKRKEITKKNQKVAEQKTMQRFISSSRSTAVFKGSKSSNLQGNKSEAKTKLQSIDMFLEQPRKSIIHQSHRNTAILSSASSTPLATKKTKPLPPHNKKGSGIHACTQVTTKMHTKETQTLKSISVSSRFCQTERVKLLTKSIQTDAVVFEKTAAKATDAFERMKEIDLEIQVLLQEKFKLYNSLESNDSFPSTIQSLGMTVLNVNPAAEDNSDAIEVDSLVEDVIAEDFTNIPVVELEQIAFDPVNEEKKQQKKGKRQKILKVNSSTSASTSKRSHKQVKTPNISLLEQIITDDRPLEDIISLDDLETTPIKTIKQRRQKKNQMNAMKPTSSSTNYTLKECSVVLVKKDFTKYLNPTIEDIKLEHDVPEYCEEVHDLLDIDEVTATNELQFDMLDVSEDIVVGDNCEIKFIDDKDLVRVPISEEIILDNSQTSGPHTIHITQNEVVCKTYDYSTDENLRRDSIVVTGHADAVLAIECIDNSFLAACLDGNVYHFSGDGQLITTLKGSNLAVTCVTIVREKYGTTVYTGSLDSRIRYYDLETGLEKGPECNVLSPIQTMDRAWDTIFVGTRTGFVLQFECKNNMLIPVSTVKFSEQSILALRAMKEGPRKVLLVAARSEQVTVKDAQTGLLLRTLRGPAMTVYSLLYEDGKVYCGTSTHQIHLFEYASGSHVGAHEGGKGAVCLRATGGLVFAGCYDGCVYVFREGEPRPRAQLRGPSLMLLSLALVGTKIIAGYKDRSLYIWKIPLSILQEMIL